MVGAFLSMMPLTWVIHYAGVESALWMLVFIGLVLICIASLNLREPTNTTAVRSTMSVNLLALCSLLKRKKIFYSPPIVDWPLRRWPCLVVYGVRLFCAQQHVNVSVASGLVSLCYIGFGIGGPLFGYLSDRKARRMRYMLLGLVVSSLCFICVVFVSIPWLWLEGVLLCGFGVGTGSFMLGFTMAKEINPLRVSGSVVSLINSGDALLGAVSEPFIGRCLDWGWSGASRTGLMSFRCVIIIMLFCWGICFWRH